MWTLLGPFDDEEVDKESQKHKQKFLKEGDYALGRKNSPLIINSKKISSYHCTFKVGKLRKEDVVDPLARPSFKVNGPGKKGVLVSRGEDQINIQGDGFAELQENDILVLPGHHKLEVKWESICCYTSPARANSVPLDACAELGINVVHGFVKEVNIHLSTTYTASPAMAASLMGLCRIAKPDWLQKVIRLFSEGGTIAVDKLPATESFKPTYTPSLPPKHQDDKIWEPKPERRHLFKNYRFVCIAENKNLETALREILSRGEGSVDVADIHEGAAKFRRLLSRANAKDSQTLVFVADSEAMKAASEEKWDEIVEVAKEWACDFDFRFHHAKSRPRYNLHVVTPSTIVNAVLDVDTSILKTKSSKAAQPQRASSPLPSFVPNSIPEEPSIPSRDRLEETSQSAPSKTTQDGPPKKRLPRRFGSRQLSQEPSTTSAEPSQPEPQEIQEPEAPQPRRRPRRYNATAGVAASEDNSAVIAAIEIANSVATSGAAITPDPVVPVVDLTTPATNTRPSRMKRRFGEKVASAVPTPAEVPAEEPPLKKFQALFDASDPLKAGTTLSEAMSLIDEVTSIPTQSRSSNLRGFSAVTSSLEPVNEGADETESQTMSTQSSRRGIKRRAASSSEDQDMADVEEIAQTQRRSTSRAGSTRPVSKRAAIENVNAVERTQSTTSGAAPARATSKPPSTFKSSGKDSGAAPGKPDTDEAFLKAVASTKRGKKHEDAFDREFNKLKISKPELDRGVEEEEQWAVLEEFGDESNIRGNFMVVVEMDVFKDRHPSTGRQQTSRPEWEGLPNFKKFKKKEVVQRTRKVELFASEGNDYSVSDNFWNDDEMDKSRSQSLQPPQSTQSRPIRSQALAIHDSDSDGESLHSSKTKRPAYRTDSAKPSRATTKSVKSMPLFLEDEDDDFQTKNVADSDSEGPSQTLRSSGPSAEPATRRGTKRKATVVEDESDDDFAFKGFKRRSRR
ncbi:hypothetical protein K435DRAFT_963801 [Dendrothele bispora CBS 962.96]|uniref:FHA domain-containing protein n=1 Tax=Dendrothele bispora (strain CBS 962.96) TaxID=1314807 RepID=A0A4S8MFG1_DENBC|nr:hypothetical protein K435DRAFT_963801 [Dendrothele bispora CBS 962.96]